MTPLNGDIVSSRAYQCYHLPSKAAWVAIGEKDNVTLGQCRRSNVARREDLIGRYLILLRLPSHEITFQNPHKGMFFITV